MTTLKTITFTQDAAIVNEGRVPRSYRAGETHTLRADQAQRWIKRGMAAEAAPIDEARARMEALRAKTAEIVVEPPKVELIEPVKVDEVKPAAPDAMKTTDIRPGPAPRGNR